MSESTPRAALAASGLFMLAGGYYVLTLVFTMVFSANASGAEGYLYLMAGLFLIGGVLTAVGVPSLASVHKGPFGAAGLFGALVGLAGTSVLVLPMLESGAGEISAFLIGFQLLLAASTLFGIFTGIAMLGAKGIPVFKAGGGLAFLGSLGSAFLLAVTLGLFGGGIAAVVGMVVLIALGTTCLLGGIGALASR